MTSGELKNWLRQLREIHSVAFYESNDKLFESELGQKLQDGLVMSMEALDDLIANRSARGEDARFDNYGLRINGLDTNATTPYELKKSIEEQLEDSNISGEVSIESFPDGVDVFVKINNETWTDSVSRSGGFIVVPYTLHLRKK